MHCEWTKVVWFVGCFGLRYQKASITKIEWLLYLLTQADAIMKVKSQIVYTFWYICKGRCEVQLGKKAVKYEWGDSQNKICSELAKAWVGSGNGNSKMNGGIKDSPVSWKAPELGWIN